MFRKSVALMFAGALVVSALSAQTVDELLAKNLEAKGGKEKLKAIQSMRLTGKMTMGGGMEAPFTLTKKRPGNVRMDFTFQGMTGTQAYDGETGWMVMPFMGKKDPEKMAEDMLKEIKEEADFDGPMIDYAEKGHKVEFVGKEDVQGTPAYKLKLTMKDGDESYVYLDADAYLEIRMESKRKMQGQEVELETIVGDYKEVNGMLVPHSIESRRKGGTGPGQAITVEKVEFDLAIDASMFKMPEVKKEAPAAEKKPN